MSRTQSRSLRAAQPVPKHVDEDAGELLRHLREERYIPRDALPREMFRAGVPRDQVPSRRALFNYENGQIPQQRYAIGLARFFERPPHDIWGDVQHRRTTKPRLTRPAASA